MSNSQCLILNLSPQQVEESSVVNVRVGILT